MLMFAKTFSALEKSSKRTKLLAFRNSSFVCLINPFANGLFSDDSLEVKTYEVFLRWDFLIEKFC